MGLLFASETCCLLACCGLSAFVCVSGCVNGTALAAGPGSLGEGWFEGRAGVRTVARAEVICGSIPETGAVLALLSKLGGIGQGLASQNHSLFLRIRRL